MKIRCSECGKRYDYDVYTGICPRCSVYNKPDEKVDDVIPRNAAEISNGNYSKKNNTEISGKNGVKASYVAGIVIVVLMILVLIIPIFLVPAYIKNKQENNVLPKAVEPSIVKQGEAIPFSDDEVSIEITIEGAQIDHQVDYNIPDEYEMVRVDYHISEEEEHISDYNPNYIYTGKVTNGLKPYMKTKSGYYLESLSVSQITRALDMDYDKGVEMGISSEFDLRDGHLYYIVKKDDVEGLWISNVIDDNNVSAFFVVEMEVKEP